MFRIGCHISVAAGYLQTVKTAKEIGANTFQYFSRNPRGGSARAVDESDINAALAYAEQNDIACFMAHAPYTLNACSADPKIRYFAIDCFKSDLKTLESFCGAMYNFHPGSHTGQGTDEGITLICRALNEAITPKTKNMLLLETMSGKGSEIGGNFLELKRIIDGTNVSDRLGVLLDTCHVYSAGYDIVNNLDGVLEEFDKIVGIKRLKAIHLNDSQTELGSKKDRHEMLGDGTIGIDAIARIINHKHLRELPFYLETPNEPEGYAKEIALLKSLRN